jgi:hypothetical protein
MKYSTNVELFNTGVYALAISWWWRASHRRRDNPDQQRFHQVAIPWFFERAYTSFVALLGSRSQHL